MNVDTDSLPWRDLPVFLDRAEQLADVLKAMSYDELKKLWNCNDKIASLNIGRLAGLDLRKRLTPALLAYEGIQYQYMAPGVFTRDALDYVREHLRILSGFYGFLKPMDGVAPYRLEMGAKLATERGKDLYGFWGDSIARRLFDETDCIIDLASKEYSRCVSKYLPSHVRLITCVFGEEKNGKVVEKGTMCKMARGEMVRYMAENHVEDPEQLKSFDHPDYKFDRALSNDERFVFLRKPHDAVRQM